jgi:hypothetical protein
MQILMLSVVFPRPLVPPRPPLCRLVQAEKTEGGYVAWGGGTGPFHRQQNNLAFFTTLVVSLGLPFLKICKELYSMLLYLPLLRFHYVGGGCMDLVCGDFGIGMQSDVLTTLDDNVLIRHYL